MDDLPEEQPPAQHVEMFVFSDFPFDLRKSSRVVSFFLDHLIIQMV